MWIRFPKLAMEYYDHICHRNRIGKTIKIDYTTKEKSRGKYVRVCVMIDIKKPPIPQFQIGNKIIKVEYEGIHLIYFNCGTYGHSIK